MNNKSIVLPSRIYLDTADISLSAFELQDKAFYVSIYSDAQIMKFINECIDLQQTHNNFKLLLSEMDRPQPKYISYIISHGVHKLGIFGVKLIGFNTLESGTILLKEYQQRGWSKKIKQSWINFAVNTLNVSQLIAYCKHNHQAANRLNKGLGFELNKQFIHKNKKHLMNKWVLNCHS